MLNNFKFIIIIALSILVAKEKSSVEIQNDINYRNNELNIIKNEIKEIEENIIKQTKKAISTSELLLKIEKKINLTEKLLVNINNEMNSITIQITQKENQIIEKDRILNKIRKELKSRLIHLYKKGKPSIIENIFLSNNWNDAIYKTKYLKNLSNREKELQNNIKQIISELNIEKNQLKKEIKYKKNLRINKIKENNNLQKNKKEREFLLAEINEKNSQSEVQLINKQELMSKIQEKISSLLKNKERILEKEKELARIRALKNMSTSGNFIKMKGSLPWPVDGKIISRFGLIENKELNTITENLGIEIKTESSTNVISVFDGVVTEISDVKGYVIIILHGEGYRTVYWGMEKINVEENDYVQAGMVIGELYSNKILQFQLWSKEKKLNPEKWLRK